MLKYGIYLKYVFLCLLAVFSTIHLIHSYMDKQEKRKYTKGFLLPMIILYYIFSVKGDISYLLLSALITSWLGDVLLIPKGNKWFTIGGISFLISHILFILSYVPNCNFGIVGMKYFYIVLPVALVYFTITTFVLKTLKPYTPKMMFIPLYSYLIANSTMNVFALIQLISNPCPGSIVAYVGAVLFFISDVTLFFVRLHENKNIIFKKHFTVMLTYILGELLITQGMIMMTGISFI